MDPEAPEGSEPSAEAGAESRGERDELERLSEEFLGRRRRGEPLDLAAFAAQHPAHAEEILAVFPTLLRLESARSPEPARQRDRRGRWSILRELGRGGMGVVYLAEDEATGERAALKLVATDHPEAVLRFRREAEALARLEHPGLCRVLEVAPEGGPLWLALEYVEGETLADVLRRERRARDASGRDPGGKKAPREGGLERWLSAGQQVASALHAAHEAGLVHRDIKPANIMLTPDGRAVVLDFGLAQGDLTGEQTRITHTGVPVGTPAYMSPEQVRAGSSPPDRRTDVYSLGATLYEALTLEPPFSGPTVASLFSQILTAEPQPARQRDPTLPRDLEVVLATALAKQPHRRYASARHLAEELGRVQRGERVRARPAGPLRRLGAWAVRNPVLAASTGAVALALVTGLVVALVFLARVGEARDREAAAGRRARARALTSAAAEAQRTDAMLALLLAREAVRAERNAESITQLHASVCGSLERARLEGHGGPVTSLAWDQAGRSVLTGCKDGRARLFEADGALRLTVPAGERLSEGSLEVALAPDGTRFTTREEDGTVRLWGADGGELARLAGRADPASQAVFLADGAVAVGRRNGEITLYEPGGGRRAGWRVPLDGAGTTEALPWVVAQADPVRLHVLTRDLRALTYDAQGQEVLRREQAVGARNARVFEGGRLAFVRPREDASDAPEEPELLSVLAPDGTPLGSLRGDFRDAVLCGGDTWWAAWSASTGPRLVGMPDGGVRVRILDLQRAERPETFCAAPDGSRVFTGRRLASITFSGAGLGTDALRVWTPLAVPLAALTTAEDMLVTAAFSPDGRRIALGRHSGGLATVHVTAPVELATEVPRWRGSVGFRYPATLLEDGRNLVTFSDEQHLRILREDGSERARFRVAEAGEGSTTWISHLPAQGLVLITEGRGSVAAYDLDGHVRLRVPAEPAAARAMWVGSEGGFVTEVAGPRVRFHASDGGVRAERPGRLCAPDPARGYGDEVAVFEAPASELPGRVHVCGTDGAVRRTVDLAPGDESAWYHGSPAGPAVLVSQPGGMAGGRAGRCLFLDAQGHTRWEAELGGVGMRIAVISSDGERVALLSSGGLSLRDAAGAEVADLRLPGAITSAAFDGRGQLLVAGSASGFVRVWDRAGRLRFELPNQGGGSYACLSADGRRLATVTAAMARLYTTDVDELEALATRRLTRGLTAAERAHFAELLDGGR